MKRAISNHKISKLKISELRLTLSFAFALTLLLTTPNTYGAAEPTLPLFNIIVGCMTRRTKAETSNPENTAALEKIIKLMGEYVENPKPISAGALFHITGGKMQPISCYKDGILQTIAQHDISPANIVCITGHDYRQRVYGLISTNPAHAHLLSPEAYSDPLTLPDITRALDPSLPGVWFAPGKTETFLSLHCSHYGIKKANKQALKAYKALSENDKNLTLHRREPQALSLRQRFTNWAGFAQKQQPSNSSNSSSSSRNGDDRGDSATLEQPAELLYDPQINSVLPPEILNIIFKLLKKTVTKKFTFVSTDEGFTLLPINRALLPSERVVCIAGNTVHGHTHGLFSHPSNWPQEYRDTLKNSDHEKENPMISHQLIDHETLAVLAGTPQATFSVPSLAELLVTKKLTKKFYKQNCKLVELDLLDRPEPDFLRSPQEQVAQIKPLENDGKDDGEDEEQKHARATAANNKRGFRRLATILKPKRFPADPGCRQQ